VNDLERIEAIINKSPTLTITDMNLLEGVITVIMEAVADEREACAEACKRLLYDGEDSYVVNKCVEAICARGKK
jgi:hypothetical protein